MRGGEGGAGGSSIVTVAAESGEFILTTVYNGDEPCGVAIDCADKHVRVSDLIVDYLRDGTEPEGACFSNTFSRTTTLDGDLLTVCGLNRTVTYRLGAHDESGCFYEAELVG